jgi:hypothetical protein
MLFTAYKQHGSKWSKVGEMVGRLPEACRDHWRVVGAAPGKNKGRWSTEEEATLIAVVMEYAEEAGLVRVCCVLAVVCASSLLCLLSLQRSFLLLWT